jgi:hypothetical protein
MSERIQRRRTKGWRMPENTVYVGRGSKWGNRYRVNDTLPAETAVELYEDEITCPHMCNDHEWANALDVSELAGKNLACWCPLDQPCHADVLLELANRATP